MPCAVHFSKSLQRARSATVALTAELPPSALPRGTGITGVSGPPLAVYPQSVSLSPPTRGVKEDLGVISQRIRRSGFQQKNVSGWIRRQPVGQNGSGGSSTDDHDVEHPVPFRDVWIMKWAP